MGSEYTRSRERLRVPFLKLKNHSAAFELSKQTLAMESHVYGI